MLGDRPDRHAAALGGLHQQLLIDERDFQVLRDCLSYLAGAARDIARHRYYGHMLLSSLPLRSDTSIGCLTKVCQGLIRNIGQT